MKKIILLLVLFIAPNLHSAPLKYICSVGNSILGPPEAVADIAIIYTNRYKMVYPKTLNCMNDYNKVVCIFTLDRRAYNLEFNLDKASTPVKQYAGEITKVGIVMDVKSKVFCRMEE